MENLADWELKNLNDELTLGKELAKQLQYHFHSPSSSKETRELLLHRVLNSYEKALRMLKTKETPQPYVTTGLRMKSESPPTSQRMSPCSEDSDLELKRDHHTNRIETPRKRKNMIQWTKHVQVTPAGTGLESHVEDGYSWRKYGQKDILGAKYPRGYYRCTFRHVHGCQATKQVQQTNNDEPTIFEIRYHGRHTCNQISDPNKPPYTAVNQDIAISTAIPPPQTTPQETLMNFQGLTVKKSDYNLDENQFHHQQFADHINGYRSSSQAMDREFGENIEFSFDQANNNFLAGNLMSTHASESNQYNDLFSAASSAANSPTVGLDFPFGQMEYAPNFTFNNLGFFS